MIIHFICISLSCLLTYLRRLKLNETATLINVRLLSRGKTYLVRGSSFYLFKTQN